MGDTCILTFTNGGGTSGTASIALNGSSVFPAQVCLARAWRRSFPDGTPLACGAAPSPAAH
jgi:hypothetical protein